MPTINKPKRKNNSRKKHGLQKMIQEHVYSTTRWKHVRKSYFMQFPLCQKCLAEGRTTETEEIHHRIPLKTCNGDLNYLLQLAFDYDNLMSVCTQCHHDIHRLMKAPHSNKKFTP